MEDISRSKNVLGEELRNLGRHIRDVTANQPVRELAREAPRLDDPVYVSMLQTQHSIVFVVDDRGRVAYSSPTSEKVLGRSCESLISQGGFDWIHPDDHQVVVTLSRRMRAGESPLQATWRVLHHDGHWVWLETSVTHSFRAPSGAALTVVFARDVSETQEALRALSDSEERFRAMAENASDLVLEIDGEGRILFVSQHCAQLYGVAAEDTVGQRVVDSPLWTSIPAEDRQTMSEGYARSLGSKEPFDCEFRYTHADGTLHWMHSSARAYDRSDDSTRLVITGHDVTARVRAQREVEESERRHRVIADAARDMISECDTRGRLIYASPAIETILGYKLEQLRGTATFALTHPDDFARLAEQFLEAVANQKPARTGPYRAQHRDGSWRWLTSTGVAYSSSEGQLRYLSVTRDITEERRAEQERRKLEEHLQWSQKLESLGVMAGGIAHDFNNLLTPILGDANLALMDLPEGSPARIRLTRIQKAAHRAASLTNQMLAYAVEGPMVVQPVDLTELVQDTMQLLESAIATRASLSFDLADALPSVEGDAGQLTQVAINLATNAAESISEGKGAITVRTGSVRLESDVSLLGEVLTAGRYAFLEISDNGSGMNDPTQERIFDPFYTTKFTGRGLGLASALGIVRGHGGSIEVHSLEGEGTRMRVLLPASHRATGGSPMHQANSAEWRSSGTVLVVDDDEGVREFTAETLRRAGFDVLCAADGQEGVEIFRERADEIRAVLLDRTMPLIGGEEAFAEMRSIRKDARVILVSGYSRERAEQHLSSAGLAAFLQKPFLPETLLDLLRSVLGE